MVGAIDYLRLRVHDSTMLSEIIAILTDSRVGIRAAVITSLALVFAAIISGGFLYFTRSGSEPSQQPSFAESIEGDYRFEPFRGGDPLSVGAPGHVAAIVELVGDLSISTSGLARWHVDVEAWGAEGVGNLFCSGQVRYDNHTLVPDALVTYTNWPDYLQDTYVREAIFLQVCGSDGQFVVPGFDIFSITPQTGPNGRLLQMTNSHATLTWEEDN